jgi:hypothetical protein
MKKKKITPWIPENTEYKKSGLVKGIPYEAPVLIWDSEEGTNKLAYYFEYNEREKFHLFLVIKDWGWEKEVRMYTIDEEICSIRDFTKSGIPIFDTDYFGTLGESESIFDDKYEKKFAIKRMEELEKKLAH